jgi:hypothetical protein
MTTILKQSTEIKVRIGPFVDASDAVTPETGITLGAADQAELLKANGAATVDISGATWAAITGAGGWYDLTLTTSHTNTVGEMEVVIQDSSVCLPVFAKFQVVEEAVYDDLYAGSATGYPTAAEVRTEIDSNSTQLAAIVADTNELQTDWIDGGRLDLIVDIIATDVAAVLVDTGTDGVKIATGQTITALTITTLTVTNNAIGWNASWDAEVQSEVDDGLIAKGLDHLVFASVTGTDIADNSIIAKLASKSATADWDSFTNTTDSLEAQADAASSGVTVAYAIPAAALSLLQNNSALTILKYDSLSVSLTGLGSVTNKTETYFVVKNKKTDADAASIILISEGTGLEYVEGAAYGTAGHGSFTWTNTTTGAATIAMDEAATGTLTARTGLYWAVKVIRSTGAANTLVVGEGSCDITDGIIRAVS